MTFIVFGVIAFLILLVFRKYKSVLSVIVTIIILMGLTAGVMAWGTVILSNHPLISFFYSSIGPREFYHLMAFWFCVDILCAGTIIGRYREYKKINRGL
jgi:hypothetical protein